MPWPKMGTAYLDAIRSGQQFPPIVVFKNQRGWSLLDGVNRIVSYRKARRAATRSQAAADPVRLPARAPAGPR